MVSKRIADKIAASSKKALTDAKRGVSDLDLERKAQGTIEAAKTTIASGEDVRQRVQGTLKETGANFRQRRSRAGGEIAAIAHSLESVVSNVSYADLSVGLQISSKLQGDWVVSVELGASDGSAEFLR